MGKGILVKYGEIAIKGNNRVLFENALIKNIKHALRDLGKLWIEKEQGRLFIPVPQKAENEPLWMQRALEGLQRIFGIIGVCPVDVLEVETSLTFDTIAEAVLAYVNREYTGAFSFKVDCKRANKKFPMNSMEIASELGGAHFRGSPGANGRCA